MYIEQKAHNRSSLAVVQTLWWEYGSQMGCDYKEKNQKKN